MNTGIRFGDIGYNGLLQRIARGKPLRDDGRRIMQPNGKSYTHTEMYEIDKKVYDELHPMISSMEVKGSEINTKMYELYNKYR